MKAILICPSPANGIAVLADSKPLITLPFLGESFISYWLQHLAAKRFSEVRIVTTETREAVEAAIGDGSRWGLKIEVFHEVRDLKPAEARKRYRPGYETDWPAEPNDVIEADHLPGIPEHKIFSSVQSWFEAMPLWLPRLPELKRIGLREIEPGVWAGRRVRIASGAKLIGPCWLGDQVRVGKNAVVGPLAFLEDQAVIDANCGVTESWVGPETFVGTLTEVKQSLAWGNLLINWKTGSHTLVPDSFLMASLKQGKKLIPGKAREERQPAVERPLTRRIGAVISLAQKLQS